MFRGKLYRALSVFLSGALCCGGASFAKDSFARNMTKGALISVGVATGAILAYKYREPIYNQVKFFLEDPDAEDLWSKIRTYNASWEEKAKLFLALYSSVYDNDVKYEEICGLIKLYVTNEFWGSEIEGLVERLNVAGNLNKAIKYIGEKIKNSKFGEILDGRREIGGLRNSVEYLVGAFNVGGVPCHPGVDAIKEAVDVAYMDVRNNVEENDLHNSVVLLENNNVN